MEAEIEKVSYKGYGWGRSLGTMWQDKGRTICSLHKELLSASFLAFCWEVLAPR